jgi:hypothetical protein
LRCAGAGGAPSPTGRFGSSIPRKFASSGESIRIIYADGQHNIAPDLIQGEDDYYLTFSNGSNHKQWDHHATVIWKYDPSIDNFTPLTALPEPGYHDQSYPAFLTVSDDVYMAYYVLASLSRHSRFRQARITG